MGFFVDADRLQIAVNAGLDLPNVRVNPWDALWYACMTYPSSIHFHAFSRVFDLSEHVWGTSWAKWRQGQTLLELAINCGQREIVRSLIGLKVEANNLTSEELKASFLEEWEMAEEADESGPLTISINAEMSSLEAALVAFQGSRFQYNLLIMQMTSWRRRVPEGPKVRVLPQHRNVIDTIAEFAACLPALPEFVALTPFADSAVDDVCHDIVDQPSNPMAIDCASRVVVLDGEENQITTHVTAEQLQTHDAEGSNGGDVVEKDEESKAVESSIVTAHEEEAAHLSEALLQSKADVMALSGDDVVIVRLTGRTAQVAKVLCESPHSKDCRHRVAEAQCDIFPPWANGACLLVPLTFEQMDEAQIELHAHNIVALRSDLDSIRLALSTLSNRQRPKLRPEHHAHSSGIRGVPEPTQQKCELPCDIELIVVNTFVHFPPRQLSETSAVVHSAPGGCGNSCEPKNPRLWKSQI
jgi:hypothetical protein